VRTEHLRALTGVRFFAALWVVVYHSVRHNSGLLHANYPNALHVVAPVAGAGARGVDLFFMLSGFVLALTYLDRMGGRLELRGTLRFLWLRLARIWPLYILVLLGAAVLRILRHEAWGTSDTATLTWANLLRQALMVQQWFKPEQGPVSWVGPAWSLSAEWLAYLVFPVVVLAVALGHRRLRARTLLLLSVLTMVPLVVSISSHGDLTDWVWIPRILCEFVTGMVLCAGLSRLDLTPQGRRLAGVGAIASVAAVVGWLYVVRAAELAPHDASFVVVLFLPLIACLAIGTGPLNAFLSTRALVLGGGISYALYLVHSPMLYLFRDVTRYTGTFYLEPLPRYYGELLFIPVIVFTAWLLYRFFEEPVRERMRAQLDRSIARSPITSPSDATTAAPTKP
jgi:peptidoglycan/LPS O-acetylase OafA/YrhL